MCLKQYNFYLAVNLRSFQGLALLIQEVLGLKLFIIDKKNLKDFKELLKSEFINILLVKKV